MRKDLTDEWKARGIEDEREYASLTNTIYRTWAGMTVGEYKRFKGLRSPSRSRRGSREVLQGRREPNVLRGLGIVKNRLARGLGIVKNRLARGLGIVIQYAPFHGKKAFS